MELVTLSEAARRLGITPQALSKRRRLALKQGIAFPDPIVRAGRSLVFDFADIEAWIASRSEGA